MNSTSLKPDLHVELATLSNENWINQLKYDWQDIILNKECFSEIYLMNKSITTNRTWQE